MLSIFSPWTRFAFFQREHSLLESFRADFSLVFSSSNWPTEASFCSARATLSSASFRAAARSWSFFARASLSFSAKKWCLIQKEQKGTQAQGKPVDKLVLPLAPSLAFCSSVLASSKSRFSWICCFSKSAKRAPRSQDFCNQRGEVILQRKTTKAINTKTTVDCPQSTIVSGTTPSGCTLRAPTGSDPTRPARRSRVQKKGRKRESRTQTTVDCQQSTVVSGTTPSGCTLRAPTGSDPTQPDRVEETNYQFGLYIRKNTTTTVDCQQSTIVSGTTPSGCTQRAPTGSKISIDAPSGCTDAKIFGKESSDNIS